MRWLITASVVLLAGSLEGQQPASEGFEAAVARFQAGDYGDAGRELEAVLPELTDPTQRVDALHMLGAIARAEGRYEDAIRWTGDTIEAASEIGATLAEAEARNTRGLALAGLGRYAEATESIRRSLQLHRQRGDPEQEFARLSNLGALAQMRDRYFEALTRYESALELLDRHPDAPWAGPHRNVALANLASLYQRLGRAERALGLYASISSGVSLPPGQQARILANMGALYRRLGDPFKAIETYERAEELSTESGDFSLRVSVLVNRGVALALDLGRLEEAEGGFTDVLGLARSGGDGLSQLHALLYRAETLRRAGRRREAALDFEVALQRSTDLRLVEERWKALHGLGRLAEAAGDLAGAESRYREAIAAIESLRARLEQDALRNEFLSERTGPYDALISLLLRANPDESSCESDLCDQILDLISRQRSRALWDKLRAREREGGESAVDEQIGEDVRNRLVTLWKERVTAAPEKIAKLDQDIDALEREYQRLEGGGAEWSQAGAMSIQDAQDQLDASSAFAVYWMGGDELVRIWATRARAGLDRRPADRAARQSIRKLAEDVARPGSDWATPVRSAGDLLIGDAPFLNEPGIRSLLLDAGPELHAVPWDVLPLPSAGRLVERIAVQHLVLPKSLAPTAPPWTLPNERTLLAFSYSGGEDPTVAALELADDEARSIVSLIPGRPDLRLEASAQRSALADSAPLLHFAAHAVADDERPEMSRIALASAAGDEGPDYLFLGEVEKLDLREVRLAVLSACDTERGQTIAGEGVASLGRGFLAAGAERVIAGLWRVPDRPTAALMEQLYAGLGGGADPAEALRQAKVRIASAPGMEHPYYWAGFQLSGRSRGPVLRPIPWAAGLWTLALALLVFGLKRRLNISVPGRRSEGLNNQ